MCVCVCAQRHWGPKGEVKRELYVASRVPMFMETHLPRTPGDAPQLMLAPMNKIDNSTTDTFTHNKYSSWC